MTTSKVRAGYYTITAAGHEFTVEKADDGTHTGWIYRSETMFDGEPSWAPTLTIVKQYIAAAVA